MILMETYQERLLEEFNELKERVKKIEDTLDQWEKFQLSWIPNVPKSIYEEQLFHMQKYLDCLVTRLKYEGIEVDAD